MWKISTESGAVYLYDDVELLVQRQGPFSPGIDYAVLPDDEWLELSRAPDFIAGESTDMSFITGKWRVTTPIVSIEEIND